MINKLTFDTDSGRNNYHPSIVRIPGDDKLYVFYHKKRKSGRLSDSRATFDGFDVTVTAGNGVINNTAVSWSETSFDLSEVSNTYRMIYVGVDGVVNHTDDFPMSFTKDVIILAMVSIGATSVTRLEEVEKVGTYVYMREQVKVGDDWVWGSEGNYERRLNTGEYPSAFYNQIDNKIYLSYSRDSNIYLRVFDIGDTLTWEYLSPVLVTDQTQINLNNDPVSNKFLHGGGSPHSNAYIRDDDLFPITRVAQGFFYDDPKHYILSPLVGGSYLDTIIGDITIEVYDDSDTLEHSFVITNSFLNNLWLEWPGTFGLKYLGVSVNTKLQNGVYKTYKNNRVTLNLQENVDSDNNIIDYVKSIQATAGSSCNLVKTSEFEESRSFQYDSGEISGMAGDKCVLDKTAEFVQDYNFLSDGPGEISGTAGTRAIYVLENV